MYVHVICKKLLLFLVRSRKAIAEDGGAGGGAVLLYVVNAVRTWPAAVREVNFFLPRNEFFFSFAT